MPALQIGSVVADRYRLDRPLGEGGMGVVYAATHTRTRKPVALKLLRDQIAEDAATRQRFLREARAACAVHHPNVVEIHDVLELEDGTPMMVMELLEGESLASRLAREKKIPLGELASLLLPVISAVGTAHQVGIVHRDLKPDNIFLASGGGVKVLDFGVAKLTATEGDAAHSGAITGTGAVLGTPYYMSPEQVFGEKDIDHRSDVWAMGVILYECLAGVRPTQADNIGQIFKIVMTDAIKPIASRVPGLPSPIVELVGRMLSRERTKRPADLREVAKVLARFATAAPEVPSFGAPVGATVRVEDSAASAARADARASTQSPITMSAGARKPRRVWPGALVALLVAAAGAIGIQRWSESATSATRLDAPQPTRAATAATIAEPPASAASDPAPTASTATPPEPASASASPSASAARAVVAAPPPKTAPPPAPKPTAPATAKPSAAPPPPTSTAPPPPKQVDPASYQ